MEQTREQRKGYNRWIFLILIAGSIYAAGKFPPIRPHVQLPAENLTHHPLFTLPVLGDFYLTNTLLATLIANIILLLVAWGIQRQIKKGNTILTGIPGIFSVLIEFLYGLTESTAGKWAKKIFPFFGTITLLVLIVNWMELIPGVDSIGFLNEEHLHHAHGCELDTIGHIFGREIVYVHGEHECASGVVPWVRVASTDLNFTVALALTSVVMTQVIGLQTLGKGYLIKYWNPKPIVRVAKKPGFGDPLSLIIAFFEWIVGFLEIVAEFSKVLSFSFRLFGNIFAGSVLLFVIGSLVPVFAQSPFLILEMFVGLIQAFVFGMLTMVFMSMATLGHGDHEHEH